MRIEEEPPNDDEIQPIETFVEYESALKFHTTLSSTLMTNCFAPTFKQKLNKCNDELQQSFETLTN